MQGTTCTVYLFPPLVSHYLAAVPHATPEISILYRALTPGVIVCIYVCTTVPLPLIVSWERRLYHIYRQMRAMYNVYTMKALHPSTLMWTHEAFCCDFYQWQNFSFEWQLYVGTLGISHARSAEVLSSLLVLHNSVSRRIDLVCDDALQVQCLLFWFNIPLNLVNKVFIRTIMCSSFLFFL